MAKNPAGLDTWRDYFRSSNSDIFSIIEHAIMVAASDCPYDMKVKRDGIAEMLYTSRMTQCLGCYRSELSSVAYDDDDCLKGIDGDEEFKTGVEAGGSEDSNESKVKSSSRDEDGDHHIEANAKNWVGEIEKESHEFLEEIVRIKEVIDESEGKSDEVLQLMPLSVKILKSTQIGKSVYELRKHGSKEIRNLGRRLVVEWKRMVNNAWLAAKTTFEEEEEEEEVAFLMFLQFLN